MISFNQTHDAVEGAGLRDYRASSAAPRRRRRSLAWVFVLIAFGVGFLLGATVHGQQLPCASLKVRPQILLQRGDIRAELRVARHADHRVYVLTWSSDAGGEGRHARQLEGEDAAFLYTEWLRDQVPANYRFDLAVYGARGELLGHDQATVITPNAEQPR